MNNEQQLIASFAKNSAEEIRIYLQSFKAQLYCDIRVWITSRAGESGAEARTYRGLTFNVEILDALIEGLQAARAIVKEGK